MSMYAKYEVSTSNGLKSIANVIVDNRQTEKGTNSQKWNKQYTLQSNYANDHSLHGHKNTEESLTCLCNRGLSIVYLDRICLYQIIWQNTYFLLIICGSQWSTSTAKYGNTSM